MTKHPNGPGGWAARWIRRATRLCALLAVVTFAGPPLLADMPGDVPERWRLSVGGMAADTFTEAALGSSSAGIGVTVNFEDIFDLPESKSVWRAEASWKVAKRQYIDFGYIEINRTATNLIEQDVNWGDFVYKANSTVTAGFDSTFPYAAWRYDFLELKEVHISGSVGINYLTLESFLSATGTVEDVNNPGVPLAGTVEEDVSISFPVPQFGLQIDWALTRTLAVKMYMRQLYINAAGINGGISESAIRLHWWFIKNMGISGGLDKESIDLKEYDSGDTKARFRYEVRGWSFYLNFAF